MTARIEDGGPGIHRVVPASALLQIAQALDDAHQEIASLKRQLAEKDEAIRELRAMVERAHTEGGAR